MKNSTFTSNNGFQALRERLEQAVKEKRIKLVHPSTLFEPDVGRALKEGKCFLCWNKLYKTRDGKHWFCKSKKHKERVWIKAEKIK